MNLFDTDICWVYITDDGHRRRILFCADDERNTLLRPRLEQGERAVYRRRFDNTFDALAHKLMLQSLPLRQHLRRPGPQADAPKPVRLDDRLPHPPLPETDFRRDYIHIINR